MLDGKILLYKGPVPVGPTIDVVLEGAAYDADDERDVKIPIAELVDDP